MAFAPYDNRWQGWWGYIKFCIRKYGAVREAESELERREIEAVGRAVEKTRHIRDGADRLKLIELVFWKRSCNVAGAAMRLHIGERTAQQWHGDFIRAVAREFFGEEDMKRTKDKGEGRK